jgi:tetratricopeptide (TPR) repeat protein
MSRPAAIAFALVLVAAVAARAAEGQTDAQQEEDLNDQAGQALLAEDYVGALDAFRAAYDLRPRPLLLYNVAMCYRAMLDWPAAIAGFRRYLEAGRGVEPTERIAEAERLVAEMEAGMATLVLEVSEPGARVRIDGRDVGFAPLGEPLHVRAGPHSIEAQLDGFLVERSNVAPSAGDTMTVELELEPAERRAELRAWFWASIGLTGASLAALAVTGGWALADRAEYIDGGRRDEALYDEAYALTSAADVLLGLTVGAAFAAGIIGWFAWTEDDQGFEPSNLGVAAGPGGLVLTW